MVIYRIASISQCGEVPALDRFFKRGFESLDYCEPVESVDILWILFERELGETFGLPR